MCTIAYKYWYIKDKAREKAKTRTHSPNQMDEIANITFPNGVDKSDRRWDGRVRKTQEKKWKKPLLKCWKRRPI